MHAYHSKMNSSSSREPDWALLRAFVAVAQAGSLSGAAQELGSSQPTLSRQMSQLEAQTGSVLFERTRRGLKLTPAGAALLGPVQRMQHHAREWSMAAAGGSQSLAGTVRITASEIMSAYVLPAALRALRQRHPEIQIEVVASNAVENLLEREADIALRMVRPRQSALVTRKLTEMPLALYAHRDYLKDYGKPRPGNMHEHQWVGYDRSDQLLRGFRAAGHKVPREFFGFRCDNQIVAWQAVVAGLGIGVGMTPLARQIPELVQVLREVKVPSLPVWLTAHRELKSTLRLKTVFDALVQALADA